MKKVMLLLLLVGGFVLPFFIKGPNGQPIMSISDFIPEKPDLNALNLNVLDSSSETNSVQNFYRYKDTNGNWQYTDQPPVEGVEYELVGVDTNINTINAVKPAPKQEVAPSAQAPGVAGYVEGMQNVVKDAENVQNLMDERQSRLQESLNESY